MKGIVGKKLGMTQVFDTETGVVTPVTVIEAGPCPVVMVKTVETDGYDGLFSFLASGSFSGFDAVKAALPGWASDEVRQNSTGSFSFRGRSTRRAMRDTRASRRESAAR